MDIVIIAESNKKRVMKRTTSELIDKSKSPETILYELYKQLKKEIKVEGMNNE